MNSAGLKPRGSRPISATTRGRQTAGQTDRLRLTADRRLISLSWRVDSTTNRTMQCASSEKCDFSHSAKPALQTCPLPNALGNAGTRRRGGEPRRLPCWARGALRSVPTCAKGPRHCSAHQCAVPFEYPNMRECPGGRDMNSQISLNQ